MSQSRSPSEVVEYMAHHGAEKTALATWKLALMATLGGMFIGLGTLLAVQVAGGSPALGASNPGLLKFMLGAVFPIGFIAVTLTGADLFTSNCATGFMSAWRREITWPAMGRFWLVSYMFNAVGALLAAWLFGLQTHLLTNDTATQYLINIAMSKTEHPFWMTFTKGMLANLLVCVAAMQGYTAKDTLGRMLAIWFPVMAFVALGMEHSIANLFIIPAAMMAGADIGMGQFIWGNLVPATLGNIAGGALLIGLPYALIYSPARKLDVTVAAATDVRAVVPDMVN